MFLPAYKKHNIGQYTLYVQPPNNNFHVLLILFIYFIF